MNSEPLLHVGILTAPRIRLTFVGAYSVEGSGRMYGGPAWARPDPHGVALETDSGITVQAPEILLEPQVAGKGSVTIHGVAVGKAFHWRHQEDQHFAGGLRLFRTGEEVTAVNVVGLEEYLASVIASEMGTRGTLEFLKAHAIASRSWLLAQRATSQAVREHRLVRPPSVVSQPGRLIRWYDREDHDQFDVCSDDHCQRYYGIAGERAPKVVQAIAETRGLVLMSGGAVCDARFSKSCGGMTEDTTSAWGPDPVPYLTAVRDADGEPPVDLRTEEDAARWITSTPHAFCHVTDEAVLERILPPGDQATRNFYRWTVSYTQQELAELIAKKSGIDFGDILALTPVVRGPSGRIVELCVVGSRTTMTIGKELEIRRVLSPTHLYSSAFVVTADEGLPPRGFSLRGAGWGHGVGMCQIGAGAMGECGYDAERILAAYFAGATIAPFYR